MMSVKENIITLGIESSCDETSVAVVKNGREVLSNVINSQIKIHEKYGGVVPEIASRNHIEAISRVTKRAIQEAEVNFKDIDAITPTYGPGLLDNQDQLLLLLYQMPHLLHHHASFLAPQILYNPLHVRFAYFLQTSSHK